MNVAAHQKEVGVGDAAAVAAASDAAAAAAAAGAGAARGGARGGAWRRWSRYAVNNRTTVGFTLLLAAVHAGLIAGRVHQYRASCLWVVVARATGKKKRRRVSGLNSGAVT